jgi:hypothetical protein
MTTPKPEHWSAALVRIGNQAVREAQAQNRRLGIPNWYSLNGRLVSDAPAGPVASVPPVRVATAALSAQPFKPKR